MQPVYRGVYTEMVAYCPVSTAKCVLSTTRPSCTNRASRGRRGTGVVHGCTTQPRSRRVHRPTSPTSARSRPAGDHASRRGRVGRVHRCASDRTRSFGDDPGPWRHPMSSIVPGGSTCRSSRRDDANETAFGDQPRADLGRRILERALFRAPTPPANRGEHSVAHDNGLPASLRRQLNAAPSPRPCRRC
jgi:hypothetical protein